MVSAAPPAATQSALQCPKCAGQSAFDPNTGGLTCGSCGHVRDLAHPDDADAHIEYGYDPSAPEEEPASRPDTLEHPCPTCRRPVIFTGQQPSDDCPNRDGAVALAQPT